MCFGLIIPGTEALPPGSGTQASSAWREWEMISRVISEVGQGAHEDIS